MITKLILFVFQKRKKKQLEQSEALVAVLNEQENEPPRKKTAILNETANLMGTSQEDEKSEKQQEE